MLIQKKKLEIEKFLAAKPVSNTPGAQCVRTLKIVSRPDTVFLSIWICEFLMLIILFYR